ncbi:MAG: hypothetical protein RJA22_3246, partial [Verrucomicrobiota bacterium]
MHRFRIAAALGNLLRAWAYPG